MSNAACATFDPYISDDTLSTGNDYETVKTGALAILHSMDENVQQLEQYNFWTGLVVLGAGIAAGSFAAFDGSRDAIVASGIVGAGAGGLRLFVPIQARQEIYLHGYSAIRCAISSTDFASSDAGDGQLQGLAASLQQRGDNLNGLLASAPFVFTATKRQIDKTSSALMAAEAALSGVIATTDKLATNKAKILENAVRAVVLSVNGQITKSRLDPDGALAAVKSEIEARIAGQKEKIETLEETSDDAADTAENLASTAEIAAAAATESGLAAADKDTLKAESLAAADEAQNAEDIAKQLRAVAKQMLEGLGLPEACFRGVT